jgi:hypothetical protein
VSTDVVGTLLPALTQPWREEFNIFNVMHHGTHEKQLSNIFTWLLDAEGSHNLGDRFLRIFLNVVNRHPAASVPFGAFTVEQERNTAEDGISKDISDIVLVGDDVVVVIENYYMSDAHFHSYQTYLDYGKRRGGASATCVVVMLCGYVNENAWAEDHNKDWQSAPVVTYTTLLSALSAELSGEDSYRARNPKPAWFIDQLVSYFVKGTPVNEDLIAFVAGMCDTGEAERYRVKDQAGEADRFAQTFSELARQRFIESRGVLSRVKSALRTYSAGPLLNQIETATQTRPFGQVSATYQGIYEWTINFLPAVQNPEEHAMGTGEGAPTQPVDGGAGRLQVKFGPSAWFANESPEGRKSFPKNVPPDEADYTRLFLTWNGEIRQSKVSMLDVLEGLPDTDTRLRDEVLALVHPDR